MFVGGKDFPHPSNAAASILDFMALHSPSMKLSADTETVDPPLLSHTSNRTFWGGRCCA